MKIIDETIPQFELTYPLEQICQCPLEQIVIMDIETTGFTARSSYLYLIGAVFFKDNTWQARQWFSENYSEEDELLADFFSFLINYRCIIHFNGTTFDIPYLTQKCSMLKLPYTFHDFTQVDVYRKFNPFRALFKLPDCKQSTLEKACGLFREDPFNGGELISVYKEYVKHPDEEALRVLLLHNLEDIKGLLHILPILAVHDLLHCPVHVKKVHAGNYTDHTGATKAELLMELELPVTLPFPVTTMFKQCYCKAEGSQATIKIPIYTEEMKYFYPDYKEYYFLPDEDRAIHKSVSNFVSKESRVPATASNCYVRKTAYFLPQWEEIFSPCFVRNYKDKDLFFELTNDVKKDRAAFDNYARHILSTILTS